ncbi:MAG: hypothetical protein ACREV3_01550 [Gammaproteobacteria bacterium]
MPAPPALMEHYSNSEAVQGSTHGPNPIPFSQGRYLKPAGQLCHPRWGKCTASVVIHQPQLRVAHAHKQNVLGKPPPATGGTEIAKQASED